MKNDLTICIDTIYRMKENESLIVTGWALNERDQIATIISVENTSAIANYEIRQVFRPDVNSTFSIQETEVLGFQIELFLNSKKGDVPIHFSSNGLQSSELINLEKKYPLLPGTEGNMNLKINKLKKGLVYLKNNGLRNTVHRFKVEKSKTNENYQNWIAKNEKLDTKRILSEISDFEYKPLISVVMPVYNVEERWLVKCIESVQKQYYQNWELCIADDASTDENVKKLLDSYKKEDQRIKVVYREKNGHISKATNSAIEISNGEYIALLDNDDELTANALYEVVRMLNKNPQLDLIYSDEDKIDMNGVRSDPAFKPDWSPDLLMGTNYISHLGVYRKSIIDKIGGFRVGYEGSQDYDLVLRFVEQTNEQKIGHISKILYHWRILPTSTAGDQSSKSYAFEAGLKAVQDAIVRRKIKGTVTHGTGNGLYNVTYDVLEEELVSIIIPTKNGYKDLKRCVDSIIEKTSYSNYEIIIADNGSDDEKMKILYKEYSEALPGKFKVEVIDIPFNFSKINNIAEKRAAGKYLLFLNNDIEVISNEWITKMVSFAQQERIGCVGAKLLYPNETIQHAGIILGLGGIAGHSHYGYPNGDFGYFGRLEINVNYLAVTAACLLVRKTYFEEVNGFDEELTVAFNDVDLCLKVFDHGYQNVWLSDVELYHFESQTRGYENTRKKRKRFETEKEMMEKRWGSLIENDPYYNPNLTRKIPNFSIRN